MPRDNNSIRLPWNRLCGHTFLLIALSLVFLPAAGAATIWVEGEKPVRSTMNRHSWYEQVKRDQLSGGDLISNYSQDKPGEAAYEFRVPQAGEYEFWVRANPVQARLAYRLDGGEWTDIDMEGDVQGRTNLAADGKPDMRFVAWIRVGKLALKQGRGRIEFRMHGPLINHGMLDCFVLANEPFRPQGILKPDEIAAQAERVAAANQGWFPFSPRPEQFEATSGFDLRPLNEAQAGDGGFIGVRGSEFIHTKTGRPVRFWAVNGPSHDLRNRDLLQQNARLLAKYGVNLVRIHGALYDGSGNLRSDAIAHRIAIVESMKEEGIYSHLSIYFPLWMQPKPDTPWLKGYDGKTHPFAALYFNPDFQTQYREWWKAVLLTPSPETGRKLIDEPALAGLEMINEDSYFFWTFAPDRIPDAQLRLVETQFADWLKQRYGSLEAAIGRWIGQKTSRDNPAEGRIGMRPLWNMFNEKSARDQDTAAFLLESQRRFYDETRKFLRDLGFKGVITCSNWATASPQVFGPLEKYSYTVGDFIDRHGYFGCNHKGDNAAWSIRDGHTYSDRSALRFEPEEPGKPKIFVHPVMDPSYDGKPSMISETTFTRPNRFRSEAPLYYAAYGALQDTDCIVHFSLDSSTWTVKPGFFMQPWTLMSPAMMGQFPAAALLYRRGLIESGDLLVELNLGLEDLRQLKGTPLAQDAALDELRLKDVPQGAALAADGIIDPLVHYAGRTNVNFKPEAGPARLADLSQFIDRQRQTVVSSTRQLKLDYGKGVLYLNAPAVQGVSGALKAAGPTSLKDVNIASDMELGHIVVVSLDEEPLASSRRMLVQVMSEEKNNNFRTEDAGRGVRRIASIGEDPWLVRDISGTLGLKRSDAATLKVTALDHSGYPVEGAGAADRLSLRPTVLYYLIQP